jgi:hypothetical protein
MEWNEVLIINKKYKISKLKLFGYATAHNYDVSFAQAVGSTYILLTKTTFTTTGCPKNGVLTVPYGVEEITVNVRKMLKKFYWTYLLIWRSLKVALNRSIILKYMYEIVMAATSHRTYYHKVQDHSLPISNLA